jgi:amidase
MSTALAMTWQEWAQHDGLGLAGLVKRREVTPRELAAQAAVAVEHLNPRIDAVLEVFQDVLADPEADRPAKDGAFFGVPTFLKDAASGLKGRVQESGSALMRGYVVPATDPTVENLLRAGLIPIGRSTLPEFAMTIDTATAYADRLIVTRNPWNLERSPVGSSGGASALVSAGVTPIGSASDGGGSIRIPASFCGLVGLKPTRGRVPRPLAQSEFLQRNSNDGVLTRTVRDTAAAFDYLARIPNGGSFVATPPLVGSFLDELDSEPSPLRVALCVGWLQRSTAPEPQVVSRTREVAQAIELLGHRVEEVAEASICDWDLIWWNFTFQCIGTQDKLRLTAAARGVPLEELPRRLSPMVRRMYLAEDRYTKTDVWQMMANSNRVTRAFGKFMENYDVLLMPTLAVRVPEANGPYSLEHDVDLDVWLQRLLDACRYTMPANETGLPAIAIPGGLDSDKLPMGVQLYGNFRAEAKLLQLAAQLERARSDWFGARPPLHVTALM